MKEQPETDSRTAAHLVYLIINVWAMTLYLPLRRQTGKDHIGITGLLSVFFIPLYATFANAPDILILLPVFITSIVMHRLGHWRRHAAGRFEHTYYGGDPWAAKLLLRCKDERKCKVLGEPVLAFCVGVLLLPYGDAVGGYFMAGALALGVSQAMLFQQDEQRLDDMRNGMIENEALMRRFHEQRKGRR
ncbi:MAG TPA: hypothetical protein VGN12_07700 [Pirellulales bacterium]|jgi:hypothetical protein